MTHPSLSRRAFSLLLASALAGCALPPSPPAAEPLRLRVIAFNDFHGNLEIGGLTLPLADPARPGQTVRVALGGAAGMAGTVTALRAGAPQSVVVSSGDMFGASPLVSTLFRHESTLDAMAAIGVDVATPGNHEFDAGSVELKRLYEGGCAVNEAAAATTSCALHPHRAARFAVVAANVESGAGLTLFPRFVVREFDGVKVGFIGAVTRTTPSIVSPSGIAGLTFTDEADAINRAARALKALGVGTIIVTMHEGGEIGSTRQPADWNDIRCPDARGDGFEIAKRVVPEVDLILSAHTHQGYRCLLDGRPMMQAVSYGRGVSVADLTIDRATGRVDKSRTLSRNLPVFNDASDAAVRASIIAAEPAPYAEALRRVGSSGAVAESVAAYAKLAAPRVNQEVGRIGGGFDRSGRTDASVGRLIADSQLAATRDAARGGAQVALMNPGGVRTDLACRGAPPCVVTYGDVFSMQPFGNSLVVMTLSGAEIRQLLESQQRAGRGEPLFLIPSAGLGYRWLSSAPAGRRVDDLRLDGVPLDESSDYRVTVNSFLAEGGDGFVLLRSGRERLGGGQDLDAMLAFLRRTPSPVAAPRITWVD